MNYQWSIFWAFLDPTIGSEQSGRRPVLIVSREDVNQSLNVVNALPITTLKSNERKIYGNEVLLSDNQTGLPDDSVVLCYQIRTLDKQRLKKRIGELTNQEIREKIREALKFQLEI